MKTPSIQTAIELYREQRAQIYAVDPHEAIRNARGAQQIARDHMSRLMYELLQNTDDARATQVRVLLERPSQTLFFADDGDGLSPQAVESLSGLFFSGKTVGIGRKGIGFKAVYSVCDNPIVISGADAIVFDRARALNWMAERGLDPTHVPHQWLPFHRMRSELEVAHPALVTLRDFRTIVVLPLRQADALERVSQDLAAFDARTLLTFRHVHRLAVVIGGEDDYAVELTGERRASGICTLQDTRSPSAARWRLEWTTRTAPPDTLESLEVEERTRAQITEVLIGVQVDEEGNCPLEPPDAPPLFVFYPTRHIAPSKFLTHADFAVTSDRTQIADPSQHAYNAWLNGCVAQAIVAFCHTLVEQDDDLMALRLLSPDPRRDGAQERTLREALLERTRAELVLRSLSGKSLRLADCITLEAEDTAGFLRIGAQTGIFDRLPVEGVLRDQVALDSLKDLGVPSLSDLDLLTVIGTMLRRSPTAGPWVTALWSWLAQTEESLFGEKRNAWDTQVMDLPLLATADNWVSPRSLVTAPFFIGRLPHRPDGICSLYECHPAALKALEQSPNRETIVEFLKNHDSDDDAVRAQLVALDKATRAHWTSDSGEQPERFLRAIESWDLLNVPRPRELLRECPVPVMSQGSRGWSPAWKAYLAEGADGRHLRRVYRGNPNVVWIDRDRLLDVNLAPQVIEWLGCPSRPEVVQMVDDASCESEQRRVRVALARRGVSYTSLEQTAPPKELLKLSPTHLSEQQRESLLVILARHWEEVYQGHARKTVYYFYWSRRWMTVDEAWWEKLQALPFETDRFPETIALTDCRLALDEEVRALEPFVVQPALRSLRREERALVLKWLGHELGRAVRLHQLSWSEWSRLIGEAVPGYWARHTGDRRAPTRIRDAYRLFFKWYERFGRNTGLQRQRLLLCESSAGLAMVDAQAHTVYLNDDLDVRRAVEQRVYVVEFAERVRSIAASIWGLSRLSQAVSEPTFVKLESVDSEMQRILARRIETLRPVLLALIRHHSDGDADELEQRVRALEVHLVRRVEFVAELNGIDGRVRIEFCRPYTTQGATAYVAAEGIESERVLYRMAAQAIARTLSLREQHWVIRDLLQTEDIELWRELLEEVGVSSAEVEDSIAALSAKPQLVPPSKDGTAAPESRRRASHATEIGENSAPSSPPPTASASPAAPTSRPTPVPSARHPVTLKDGGSASYAVGQASATAAPRSQPAVPRPWTAHGLEGWRPLAELDRQRIESESRAVCMRYLAQLGYDARERDITNPGFDIEASRDGQQLLIEVKGHIGQTQLVTLTRAQWEMFRHCKQSPDAARWELWNIENLGAEAGEILVTRYHDIPVEALTPDDFSVDLSFCNPAQQA